MVNTYFNNLYDLDLIFENGIVKIFFGGNLDLFFYVISEQIENVSFDIMPEDVEIFKLFDELYNNAVNCNVFKDKKRVKVEDLKNSDAYKELFSSGHMCLKCSDCIYEDANELHLYKEEDKYRLDCVFKNVDDWLEDTIRIRNHGGRYEPFNSLFIELYNKLQSYCPDFILTNSQEPSKILER